MEVIYSILFVDDEINVLNSLKRGVREESYKTFFALSGKEALEILEREEINVIITDAGMPEMNGLTLLNIVKKKYPHIVRMMLSGDSGMPQIGDSIKIGDVFKVINKPWKLEDELKVSIKEAIKYYKQQIK
ncbi:MAG: hypothetical protein A2Y22_03640 [Clostridiales bacterium GWD2_32_59]|nr:MAG: hypothetical protein A2Y22_03640 [Clostridiales bacterium GWD2_32_59]